MRGLRQPIGILSITLASEKATASCLLSELQLTDCPVFLVEQPGEMTAIRLHRSEGVARVYSRCYAGSQSEQSSRLTWQLSTSSLISQPRMAESPQHLNYKET